MIKLRQLKTGFNKLHILSCIFILLIILPNILILRDVFNKPNENWSHIVKYLLKDYIVNSTVLLFFTGLFTIIIGITLSWIICAYDFPFRKFFKWCLLLPIAIPPYIVAYTYNGLLNYTGVIQTFLRNSYNIQVDQKYFDVMSIKGAIFIFTISLYPYVFIITKSFLSKQSASLIENARILGRSSLETFLLVILPVSRGAIIGGVSLVSLEVLNDFGVVKYFGVPTFSTAIFQTWFASNDIDSAIKLCGILIIFVLVILILERVLRGRKKFCYSTSKVRPISRIKLTGVKELFALIFCFTIFAVSFLIPVAQLLHWAVLTYKKTINLKLLEFVFNSFMTSLLVSILIVAAAIMIANYCRIYDNWSTRIFSRIIIIGYSIPGAIIAIGVIVLFVGIDRSLIWIYNAMNNKLILSTSIIMLIFAYFIRFLAIGYNSIESGFEKVGKKFFEASRMLGMNVAQTFYKIDFKMIKPAIVGGFILVFIDVLKELPLTLILRPFNFNTLATKSFEYASDEMIHEASVLSLIIIFVSLAFILFLNKMSGKEVK